MQWLRPKQDTFAPEMKYLIVGLGNMGIEYEGTRHNVGFSVADRLVENAGESFKHESLGDLALLKHRGRRMYVLKPSTFMNRSGKAVHHWLQKLSIPKENLLVVVDELQLPFGAFKLTKKGKDGGHNGLKDIQNYLQGPAYNRLRIGIGRDFQRGQQVDYVLGKWSEEQASQLSSIVDQCCDVVQSFVAIGADHTMTKYNEKGRGEKVTEEKEQ